MVNSHAEALERMEEKLTGVEGILQQILSLLTSLQVHNAAEAQVPIACEPLLIS